jgi:hypothetical protein
MKRYLAFAGEYTPKQHLRDYIEDFDELVMAKRAVDVSDPQGYHSYDWGCVLDTKTGQTHDWSSDGTAFGRADWRYPRDASAT